MSLNKSVAVSFIVIGLLLCTTPMMMDESDASVSERFTENYLFYAQFEKQSNPYDDWYFVDYLYYIDGSEKDRQIREGKFDRREMGLESPGCFYGRCPCGVRAGTPEVFHTGLFLVGEYRRLRRSCRSHS